MITTIYIIAAICTIISLPISIWAIVTSKKNATEINILKGNKSKNIFGTVNANNNGGDGIHVEN